MFIGLIQTTDRTIKLVTITVLLKLLLPSFVTKSLQAKQKTTAFFLPVIKNSEKRELSKNEISWQLQQQMPTRIWTEQSKTIATVTNLDYGFDLLPQNIYSSVEDNFEDINLDNQESSAKSVQPDLEAKIIDTFIQRIYNPIPLHIELKNKAASMGRSRIITIISSFPISKQKCQDLAMAIRKNIAPKATIEFKTKDNSIREIELRDRGYKILGNLNNYIIEIVGKAKTPISPH